MNNWRVVRMVALIIFLLLGFLAFVLAVISSGIPLQ